MSIVSGTLSAMYNRQSAKEANATNMRNAKNTRDLALRMFQESRGSTGSAVLPTYAGDFEKQLFQGAQGAYQADQLAQGTPAQQLARYQAEVDQFQPAFQRGNEFIDDIYSGELQRQQLAEAQPVLEARTALAKTQKQGILYDISARLGALDAANARKGYIGSGSGFQNAQLRSTVPLYQQAAGVGAAANLQNAQQIQAINEANRQLQLSSLSLPALRAQQAVSLRQLPFQSAVQNQLIGQKPFGMFNIGTAAFRPEQLPTVQPIPSNAAIGLTGLGALGQQVGNYYAQQQQAKALQNLYAQNQMATSPAYNPYVSGAVNYDAAAIGGLGSGATAAGTGATAAASGGELAALEELYAY